jgi:thiol-disulfide isomerase/thioredoxin
MKKTLLIFCFFKIFVGYSVVIPLTMNDSIINSLMFANSFSKKIYGKSTLLTSGNKKFIIGVFDSNQNDTLDPRDVVSISELKAKNYSLYYCADKVNSIYAKNLKFIVIEKRTYKISDLSLDKIALDLVNATDELKQYNFIDCLLTITQFRGLLRDSNNMELDSTRLNFSNGKPTIIYYTALYCQPCEKLKPLINQTLNSKSVNMIIVSSDVDKYSNDKSGTYNNICYFSQMDPSKVWSHGFPQILVFDKNGKFIESENSKMEEELIRKYAFPD